MSLQVIGAGFGRTGTHSLKSALEILGFGPCHHMYEVRRSAEQIKFWTSASQNGTMNWDLVFSGYAAQVDWPAAYFWQELAVHFPQAKVILTYRDPDEWYSSVANTIQPSAEIGRSQDPDPIGRAGSEIIYQIAMQKVFGGRFADKQYALAIYNQHIAKVQATIAPERLLNFDVRQGWAPLCEFLQLDCPNIAFPQGNSKAEFRANKPYLENGTIT